MFDRPFYLLLNLAGAWPGTPSAGTVFPKVMAVDYVRVWREDEGFATTIKDQRI